MRFKQSLDLVKFFYDGNVRGFFQYNLYIIWQA